MQTTSGPDLVGPYRLQRRLGEGGMGVVHLAADRVGDLVAVKILRPAVVAGEQGRERLGREVDALRRVRGDRVAEIIDADLGAEPPWVATRYVEGRSLDRVVAEHGPLSPVAQRRLAAGLAESLAVVHAAGVVHRDVKPGNVMLDSTGVVLIDFGLARAVDDQTLTATGLLVGTPGYLAPETVSGLEPSAATDVHGWASTVAFAASGRSPYGEGPVPVVLDRIRRGEHRLDGLDPAVEPLVRAGLSVEPRRRPTVGELRDRLAPRGQTSAPSTSVLSVAGVGTFPLPSLDAAGGSPLQPAVGEPGEPLERAEPGELREDAWSAELHEPRGLTAAAALTVLALGALVVTGTMAAPLLTLVALSAVLLATRTADRLRVRLLRRRMVHGRRRRDHSVLVAEAPWRALLCAPLTVLQALYVGLAGMAVGGAVWAFGSGPVAILLTAGAAMAATAWWGPGGGTTRRGTRAVLGLLPPTGTVGWSVAGTVVALAWVVALVAEQWAVVWWPLAGPPSFWP